MKGWIEIEKSLRKEDIDQTALILEAAGIDFKINEKKKERLDPTVFGEIATPAAFLYVREADLDEAKKSIHQEHLQTPIPDDHFLIDATDGEILEILSNSHEWSDFDVAHATEIAAERGISPDEIDKERKIVEERRIEGKPAPVFMKVLGFLSSAIGILFLLIGVILPICMLMGLAFGHWIAFSAQKTSTGKFYTYDEKSRHDGKLIMLLGAVYFVAALIMWAIGFTKT